MYQSWFTFLIGFEGDREGPSPALTMNETYSSVVVIVRTGVGWMWSGAPRGRPRTHECQCLLLLSSSFVIPCRRPPGEVLKNLTVQRARFFASLRMTLPG